jgi:hypothetical protein
VFAVYVGYDTFTLRNIQSRHPDRDFLSKRPCRLVDAIEESIKDLILKLVIDLDGKGAKVRRCEDAKMRILQAVVHLLSR